MWTNHSSSGQTPAIKTERMDFGKVSLGNASAAALFSFESRLPGPTPTFGLFAGMSGARPQVGLVYGLMLRTG